MFTPTAVTLKEGVNHGLVVKLGCLANCSTWFNAGSWLAGVPGKGVYMKVDYLKGKGNHATYKGKDVE